MTWKNWTCLRRAQPVLFWMLQLSLWGKGPQVMLPWPHCWPHQGHIFPALGLVDPKLQLYFLCVCTWLFSLAFLGDLWKKWVNIPYRYCSLTRANWQMNCLAAFHAAWKPCKDFSEHPQVQDWFQIKLSRVMVFFVCSFVWFWFEFFPSSLTQMDAVTEHVITVGLFWFCFVRFLVMFNLCVTAEVLADILTLDQTRGCYQPVLRDGLCQLLLSLGQWALEWMGLE